jgi:protein involved in polysaccharide export with SLBB domain
MNPERKVIRVATIRGVAVTLVLGLVLLVFPTPALPQEYHVGPGDVLEVSVVGEPVVSGPVTVSPDGNIVLPLVGPVFVNDLTLPQVTDKVKAALKDFIREPQIVVAMRQASPRRQFAYLLGQVARPGVYEMQEGWTVADLVAVAGGPAPSAALSKAFILRKSETIPVNLEQLLIDGNTSANLPLTSGDLVIVPETRSRVVIMGQVNKPGPYLLKAGDRVVDVLSSAGGPTPNAGTHQIGIIRQKESKPTVTPVDIDKFYKSGDMSQNLALEPGDIIYVPEKAQGLDWNKVLSILGGLVFPVLWLVK